MKLILVDDDGNVLDTVIEQLGELNLSRPFVRQHLVNEVIDAVARAVGRSKDPLKLLVKEIMKDKDGE